MQHNHNPLSSPTVRIHKSSPTPAQAKPMLAQSQQQFLGGDWNDAYHNGAYLSALPRNFHQDLRFHKRASSGSSVASAGPPSPLDQHANLYNPRIATSDAQFSPSQFDFDFNTTQNTKISQSVPDTVMFGANTGYGAVDMRRIQSQGHDDRTSYAGAPSVSTMSHHNSPATPQNFETDYSDEKTFGEQWNSLNMMMQGLQAAGNFNSMAYQQSLHDVFPEQQMYTMSQMNHRQNMMQDRLQAAQQDHLRTNSPTSNPREKSPFRQSTFNRSVQQQRPQQMPQLQKQRTSISPKELMLDERDIDENQPSLFPEQSNYQQRRQPSNLSNFYTASSFGQEASVQIPQQYPFVSQFRRTPSMNVLADSTPDFAAPMLSMESTNEEDPSSQQSVASRQPTKPEPRSSSSRPTDTSSDAGTYSCTYHGCPQRFDSPAKLQKHKREGHRQHEGHTSPTLALRNSQAGPHRCDRINPSTGKPCASVFSRPYDLTRHEDTIHNGRKQKVRCHLCTEEKTFSRNDALTRHMRVVHPDVDWVGKQKRKSPK